MYIELFDNEFAGLDNENNVTIYDYEGKKLTNEKITVPTGVQLTRTKNQAIKAKRSGENYIISIYNGTKYVDYTAPIIKEKPEQPEEPGE